MDNRDAVRAAAERSWVDVVENYQAGREKWIADRLADYDHAQAVAQGIDACTDDCPTGPHAHPLNTALAELAAALGVRA